MQSVKCKINLKEIEKLMEIIAKLVITAKKNK